MAAARTGSLPLALLAILIGVPVVLLLGFLALLGLNVGAGALLGGEPAAGAGHDPRAGGVPVAALRWGLALVLVAGYPLVLRTKLSDLVKAILLAAPVGVPAAALLVTLSDRLVVALAGLAAIAIATAVLLRAARKPWTYHVAAGFALALATFYGWPR